MKELPDPQPKKSRLERLRDKQAQTDAEIKRLEAAENTRTRKDETARKIEIGALALNHMRKNRTSPFYKLMVQLLDEYVPRNRRRLFEEFEINPEPPDDRVANDTETGSLKSHFPAKG